MLTLAMLACVLPMNASSPRLVPQEPSKAAVTLPKYPVAALAAAVDLPTHQLRAAAAVELAKRSVPLAQWLEAATSLPLRKSASERFDDDTVRYVAELAVMGSSSKGEILVRTPPGEHEGRWPVLFCWHPAGGRGADSLRMWATLADRYGLLLVAPTEAYEPYRKQGWSYHPDGYERVQEALRFVRRHYDVDEDRIMLAGLRGGGHMAWDVGIRFADQFAAILPANGSTRLGTPFRDSNMAYLESIANVSVRSMHWGQLEDAQVNNVNRSIEVLRQFGAKNANHLEHVSQLDALNPSLPGWGAFFASKRTVPKLLVKFPDRAWTPHRREFGRHHWLDALEYDRRVRVPFPPKVSAAKWRKLDEPGRLAYLDQYLRDMLPRIEASMTAPGLFAVKDRHITSFRLLLSQDMIGKQQTVVVRWRGRTIRQRATPSAEIFLREFVERFDRTFLPVVEVRVK
jgi:poly(3-hydroxybutyrate) depolymerase